MSRLSQPLPKLLVLDLDWTIWQGDCGVNFIEPFSTTSTGTVYDKYYRRIHLFPEVKAILAEFHAAGVEIAFASRNQGYTRCKLLLEAFNLWRYAKVLVAMSSGTSDNKDPHFKILNGTTGIDYKDMLFVDDLPQNIDGARELGVVSVLCNHMSGLCWNRIDCGLAEFQKRLPSVLNKQKEYENEWARHEKWTVVCDTLINTNYYEARRDWWRIMYGCEPTRMCVHDCVSMTDCYHGKLI